MLDSKRLRVGDTFVLAYDYGQSVYPPTRRHRIPPDRVVTVTFTDREGFLYSIQMVWMDGPEGGFVPKMEARKRGLRFREGRMIGHTDFAVNMAKRSRMW